MRPFKNEEEIKKVKEERINLIESLQVFKHLGDDEKRFMVRRINIISEKLIKQAMYTGTIK
jgi:hypothetical protein